MSDDPVRRISPIYDWVSIHEVAWRGFGKTFYANPAHNPFARGYLSSQWWHCLPNREKDVILLWDQKQALTPNSVEEFICIESNFWHLFMYFDGGCHSHIGSPPKNMDEAS